MDKQVLENLTVLYAEDESIIQKGIAEALTLFGVNVICARNGHEGLELFKSSNTKIDLILTDVKMPKIDGLEMVAKIREIDEDIPAVITTAHQETGFMMQSIDLGISAYVLKPINIYKLQETLIQAIEPKILREKIIEKNKKLEIEVKKNNENQEIMVRQSRFAAMGEMINMIAHQWRQPLSSIGAASFNLKYKILTGKFNLETKTGRLAQADFFTKKLEEVEFYVHNLTTTIDDFRNFYKTDKVLVNKSIDEPITNSLKIMEKDLKSNNIGIILDFKSKNKIDIYENEIVHVLINIIKNAQDKLLDYKIKDAKIEISTQDIEEKVKIEIYDNGGGIEEENLHVIFEPYFSTKKEENGTGIGLYMSKLIVENHHQGQLYAQNIREGICFTIILNTMLDKKNHKE